MYIFLNIWTKMSLNVKTVGLTFDFFKNIQRRCSGQLSGTFFGRLDKRIILQERTPEKLSSNCANFALKVLLKADFSNDPLLQSRQFSNDKCLQYFRKPEKLGEITDKIYLKICQNTQTVLCNKSLKLDATKSAGVKY